MGTFKSLAAAVLLLAGCASDRATNDWARATDVTVRLKDYRFEPRSLAFRRGTPYRLRLENRSTHQHEFTSPAFFGAIAARNPDVVSTARPEIVVDPGQEKDLYFVAVAPGRYELLCADHDFAGMTGEIVIE